MVSGGVRCVASLTVWVRGVAADHCGSIWHCVHVYASSPSANARPQEGDSGEEADVSEEEGAVDAAETATAAPSLLSAAVVVVAEAELPLLLSTGALRVLLWCALWMCCLMWVRNAWLSCPAVRVSRHQPHRIGLAREDCRAEAKKSSKKRA